MFFLKNMFVSGKKGSLLISLLTIISTSLYASVFSTNTQYEACFTPYDDCTALIVQMIKTAKTSIHVQAYSFTSAPIAKALVDALDKDIEVNVILDKSQTKNNRYSSATYLINHKVPVWIDYKPAIAHNKIILIDSNTVITGSFNFTAAAQKRNTENLLIIHDTTLSERYLENWNKRRFLSRSILSQN